MTDTPAAPTTARSATEPRTEAGRQLLAAHRGDFAYRKPMLNHILAIEAEARSTPADPYEGYIDEFGDERQAARPTTTETPHPGHSPHDDWWCECGSRFEDCDYLQENLQAERSTPAEPLDPDWHSALTVEEQEQHECEESCLRSCPACDADVDHTPTFHVVGCPEARSTPAEPLGCVTPKVPHECRRCETRWFGSTPAEPLDVERLSAALLEVLPWDDTEWAGWIAGAIAAEYARLSHNKESGSFYGDQQDDPHQPDGEANHA